MTDEFGIVQLTDYVTRMKLKIARTNEEQEYIELAFHGTRGQWRIILGLQQHGDVRKLMLIAPHIGTVSNKRRLECLEALMAINYRIAMGKFGMDLEDGEIRLEEAVPLAQDGISFEQFQLVFGAIMQTVAIYHDLLPRIIYGNVSAQEAIEACEHDFFQEVKNEQHENSEEPPPQPTDTPPAELDVSDILAEVTRIFEERAE